MNERGYFYQTKRNTSAVFNNSAGEDSTPENGTPWSNAITNYLNKDRFGTGAGTSAGYKKKLPVVRKLNFDAPIYTPTPKPNSTTLFKQFQEVQKAQMRAKEMEMQQ
jgi:hypothetical protein